MTKDAFFESSKKMLEKDEGRARYPYRCTRGKLTVGIGHNLDANGLSDRIIDLLFEEDLLEKSISARRIFGGSFFENISDNQRLGILNLVFQLGENGLRGFKNAVAAMKALRWNEATQELKFNKKKLLDGPAVKVRTPLYAQTPKRLERVCKLLLDEMPTEYT